MSMLAEKQAAARQRSVREGRDPRAKVEHRRIGEPSRPASETRLQAAVVREQVRDERDPYADVPCTD